MPVIILPPLLILGVIIAFQSVIVAVLAVILSYWLIIGLKSRVAYWFDCRKIERETKRLNTHYLTSKDLAKLAITHLRSVSNKELSVNIVDPIERELPAEHPVRVYFVFKHNSSFAKRYTLPSNGSADIAGFRIEQVYSPHQGDPLWMAVDVFVTCDNKIWLYHEFKRGYTPSVICRVTFDFRETSSIIAEMADIRYAIFKKSETKSSLIKNSVEGGGLDLEQRRQIDLSKHKI
jgi:hypothetical protein